MNLPKTIVRMEKTENTLLLLFDDDTLIKFRSQMSKVNAANGSLHSRLVEREPTARDIWEMGLMSDEDYEAQRLGVRLQEIDDTVDKDLMTLWRLHQQHGEAKGFPRPTKYPRAVAKILSEVDWGNGNVLISHEGISFIIKRP